ncbi:hypothetical protein [Candidatus Cyanaurora vandensis]|uniref:hypothetical protein n=1 Tax=Candidatus Cyanaurora vandensis TaxID=2714958 RepID=UPI00257BD3C6|nr:hypothetical protein [Candidatus Cyanaurora vandensis]
MSGTRVELRPHVLHPDTCTVSVYQDNVLVYTRVQPRAQAVKMAEGMGEQGCAVCWNGDSGAPYRDWRKVHA